MLKKEGKYSEADMWGAYGRLVQKLAAPLLQEAQNIGNEEFSKLLFGATMLGSMIVRECFTPERLFPMLRSTFWNVLVGGMLSKKPKVVLFIDYSAQTFLIHNAEIISRIRDKLVQVPLGSETLTKAYEIIWNELQIEMPKHERQIEQVLTDLPVESVRMLMPETMVNMFLKIMQSQYKTGGFIELLIMADNIVMKFIFDKLASAGVRKPRLQYLFWEDDEICGTR